MNDSTNRGIVACGLVMLGLAGLVLGIYVGKTDDAPGAALLGIAIVVGAVAAGVRVAMKRKAETVGGGFRPSCKPNPVRRRGVAWRLLGSSH